METIALNLVFALSLLRRTLLAFASETVSKDMRTTAARRGYVFARIEIGEAYALGGPMKDRLRRRLIPIAIARISFMQRYRGRPRTSRRPQLGADARYIQKATGCKRKPFGAVISIRSRQCLGNALARTCNRRRLSRRKPASAGGTRASRMHDVRNGSYQPSRIGRQRLACAYSRVCASGLVSTIRIWRLWRELPCAHSRPLPICDQCQLWG
jgi:hypothetical protein